MSRASSAVNAAHDSKRSKNAHAMHPSTLSTRLAAFCRVICSTASPNSRCRCDGMCASTYRCMSTTRWSLLSALLIRCPIPGMSSPRAFIESTNSCGLCPLETAAWKCRAAPSIAPPNRGPMVSSPDATQLTRSLPARAATMVLCAPETHGPWSAVSTITISMNLDAHGGSSRLNHSSEITSPIPRPDSMSVDIGTPAYVGSSPRSSQIVDTMPVARRTRPSFADCE
eukprot:Amastigsp_a841279_504.p3 type:complete len:227 gc:universal Amastigsp_a841279_504:1755-1075(-)